MKKANYLLGILYFFLLYFLSSDNMKIIIALNFGLYILLESIFNKKINTDKYPYNKRNLFLYYNIIIIVISLFFGGVSYYLSTFIHIDKMEIYSFFTCLFLVSNNSFLKLNDFLSNHKIGKHLNNTYYTLLLIINNIMCLILKDKYNIMFLYTTSITLLLVTYVLIYLFLRRKNKNINRQSSHNIFSDVKKLLLNESDINILPCYIYISIVILYFILNNNNYNISTISHILCNTYLFGIIFIYFIYKIITKYFNINYNNIKENYNHIVNKVLNISLSTCILLFVISWPLCRVIFYSEDNFIFGLIILLFFYLLYSFSIKMGRIYLSNKKIKISMLIGFLIKIIFEIPLINSVYRMGYNLALGGILSSSLGLLITTIIINFYIIHKYKINIVNNFSSILNIIYYNIIYLFILVLLSLIVKVDSDKYFINVIVIVFYLIISCIFYFVRKKIITKSKNGL